MRLVVLGAAAGGGFPQWNSNAEGCRRARRGDPAAKPRTQASLAASRDGESWFLFNASPDLAAQIAANECLWPRGSTRSSPIAGVVLTGADIDAIAGLLTLRERHRFALYATSEIHTILAANPIFGVLAPDCVERRVLPLHERVVLAGWDGTDSGLTITALPVPGKVPLWLENGGEPDLVETGHSIAIQLAEHDGTGAFFIPGCATMTSHLSQQLRGAAAVFFDGTLWRDDEMLALGVGGKTGKRMGHMSMSGADGVIAAFRDLDVQRKIFIHINNTNPVLLEDSAERAEAEAAGWTIAYDGLEMTL